MKLISILILFPILIYGQIQIGGNINADAINNYLGESTSLSADGNIVAVGAKYNGNNGTHTGHVRVYENQSDTWVQIGQDIEGQVESDLLGQAVSLSSDGKTMAISIHRSDASGLNAGSVVVFKYEVDTWVQIGEDILGEAAADHFGESIALSADGNVVAIGADLNDGSGTNAGHVRVFENQSDTWVQIGDDIDGEAPGDLFGIRVSLSADGSILAAGASANDGIGDDAGHVRVFENQSGNWVQIGNDIDGAAAEDRSGDGLSLSADGQRIAIGAKRHNGVNESDGHARVFENIGGNWIQLGSDIVGEAEGDQSGRGLSLSADGNILAIGASGNDGLANFGGHARIYTYESGSWEQLGFDIDGTGQNDISGIGLSLSADGSVVAVGSPGHDVGGQVRVFKLFEIISSTNNEDFVSQKVQVSPNPSNEKITISFPSSSQNARQFQLFDSFGKEVRSIDLGAFTTQQEVYINNLPAGIYIWKVNSESGKLSVF